MNKPVSQRKIIAPSLPLSMVPRPSLVERLNEAIVGGDSRQVATVPPHKLILLEAPAGYGKTTLLAEFSLQCPVTCCWYLFDSEDCKPVIFLRTLLESVRLQFPTFGEALIPLLYTPMIDEAENDYLFKILEALVDALGTEIHERFILIHCQYHEIIENRTIVRMIEYLIQRMPEQGVMILESREVPELDFASLLAARAVTGIGAHYLRFSAQEIRELISKLDGPLISAEEAEQLATSFDGWITGILMGTRLGGRQFLLNSGKLLSSPAGHTTLARDQTLFSYIVNEIFKQRQDLYLFLKEAVILQEMRAETCGELLQISEGEASRYLHMLEQRGLFVTRSGDGADLVYTCHRVLHDLLYEELRLQAPERFIQLHTRATSILQAQQRYEQAIFHAREAGLQEIAARLIIDVAEPMIEQGHIETVQQWISEFSQSVTTSYPRLLLILADIYVRKSELDQVLPLLDRLSALIEGPTNHLANPEDLPLLRTEMTITRIRIMIQQGKYRQAQLLCQRVLDSLPADEVKLRVWAHTYFGSCAELLGEPTTTIAHYQKALQLWGRHTISSLTAGGHSLLADTYRRLGNFALAEHHWARAAACWQQLHDIRGTINNMIARACLSWDQGKLEEAEQTLQQALKLSVSPLHLLRLQSYVQVSLGEFYQSQRAYDRSLIYTEEALATARQLGDANLLSNALLTLAMTYLYMGDATTADLLASEVVIDADNEADNEAVNDTDNGADNGAGERTTAAVVQVAMMTRPFIHTMRDLVSGTILLHQQRYCDALHILEQSEATLRVSGFKREQTQALLRLADCYLELKRPAQLEETLSAIQQILAQFDGGYVHLTLTELDHFPALLQVIKKEHPSLCRLLHITADKQDRHVEESEPIAQKVTNKVTNSVDDIPVRVLSPHFKIVALGEPVVLIDGQTITRWRMARAMELFFYLLDCNRPMRKEQILTALWDEVEEQTFYSTIHYLRKALDGEAAITSRSGVYKMELYASQHPGGLWYDVADLQEHYSLGKQALAEENDDTAIDAFETVTRLYQGDYLQPFYSDWCSLRRDELRRAYLDAHRQLAHIAWRMEEIEECAAHWQQMLALDSYLEQAHCGLMRCYMRQGKRGVALRQYQRCKETLKQELGAEPGPVTQNLYRRILGAAQSTTQSATQSGKNDAADEIRD